MLFIVLPVVLEELCLLVAWCVLWMLRRAVNMFVPCVPPVRGGGAGAAGLTPSHALRREERVWVSGGEARGADADYAGDVELHTGAPPLLVDPTGALPVFDGPAGVPPFPAGPTLEVAVGIGDAVIVRADHRLRVEVTKGASEYLHAVQSMVQHGHWCERRGEYREAERHFLDAWHAAPTLALDELNVCILTGLITSMRKASCTVRPELALYV